MLQAKAKEDWTEVANKFNGLWDFPNCLGAIDGKHCGIKCPQNGASLFYNYKVILNNWNGNISSYNLRFYLCIFFTKGFHSVVLMAVSDAECKFTYFDVGAFGSEGDSAVFSSCSFGKSLNSGKIDLPEPQPVFGKKLPFAFLADDAFPLGPNILKPYKPNKQKPTLHITERLFNYR